MASISSINYLAMGIKGNKQLGSNQIASGKNIDLTDGLTAEELKLIDKNKDGSISEQEYKQAFGGSNDTYKKYWQQFTSFYNAQSTKTNNGTKETSTVNSAKVASTYDKNGKLSGYTKTTVNAEGIKTVISYSVKNGVPTKTKTTKINADGTQNIVNNKSNVTTTKSQNGTAVSTDKSGKLKTLATPDGNTKVNFAYNEKGNITKATINLNGTKIVGSKVTTSKDGKTTTIKDEKGKIVAKYHTNADGETYITAYKNGNKAKCFKLDANNKPLYVNTCDTSGKNKGLVTQREYCDTGVTRKYSRDKNGKVTTSTDYKEGKKSSVQTYNASGEWATRTVYDSKGKVSSYNEFSYSKNDKGVITNRTSKKYTDSSKKQLVATYTDTIDKNGNKTKREIVKPNEQSETIEYKYKDSKLTKTVSSKGNIFKTTEYENGERKKETRMTIVNGKSTTQTTEFDYYDNTGKVQYKFVKKDDGTVVRYEYDADSKLVNKQIIKQA